MTAAKALQAVEAEAEAEADDGVLRFTLATEFGEADIAVPPPNKWRSSARRALISMGDDLTWAMTTLSEEDYAEYERLDPTTDESAPFFAEVLAAYGESLPKSGRSASSSRSTRSR